MQDFYPNLLNTLSSPRIAAYYDGQPNPVNLDVTSAYIHNIRVSQALNPCMHLLEVALRNNMHGALAKTFSALDWYDQPGLLRTAQANQLVLARAKIAQDGKTETPDYIVANLSFGFWVGLFTHPYQSVLWNPNPQLLKQIFLCAPRHTRKRASMGHMLNLLRKLRNSISHWERIALGPDLLDRKADIDKLIAWTSPAAKCLLDAIDTFNDVVTTQAIDDARQIAGRCIHFEDVCTV